MILNAILLFSVLPTCEASVSLSVGTTVPAISTSIWVIAQDRKNNYWFGSDGEGVFRYDGKSIVNYTTKDGLPSNQIREIQEDKAGNLFVGTLRGISKFDGRTFTTLTAIKMTSPDKGWRLDPDDLWFKGNSSEGGPYRYDGKSLFHLKFPKHHLEDAKLARNPTSPSSMYGVYIIYKDRKGNLWFGTSDAGLCRYDGKTINWLYEDHLTDTPAGGSFGIRSIIEDREGKFWFCNTKFRYQISPSNLSTHGLLSYKAHAGIDGNMLGTGQDYVYYQSVVQDKEGDLWLMPYSGGVWRYDGSKVIRYAVRDNGKETTMFTIYKDHRGDLWVGSPSSGLYKFNGKSFEKFLP